MTVVVACACLKNWSRSAVSCPLTRLSSCIGSSGGGERLTADALQCCMSVIINGKVLVILCLAIQGKACAGPLPLLRVL